jgi:hypothetical protein
MKGRIPGTRGLAILAGSIGLLCVGYICLGQGPVENPISKSVAPLLLVAAYCVLIPIALLARDKDEKKESATEKKKK